MLLTIWVGVDSSYEGSTVSLTSICIAAAPQEAVYPRFTEDEPEAQESSQPGVEPGVCGRGEHVLAITCATFQGHRGV